MQLLWERGGRDMAENQPSRDEELLQGQRLPRDSMEQLDPCSPWRTPPEQVFFQELWPMGDPRWSSS